MSDGFSQAGKKNTHGQRACAFQFVFQFVTTAQIFYSLIRSVHFVNHHSRLSEIIGHNENPIDYAGLPGFNALNQLIT